MRQLNENGITKELIRDTFYNEMVTQTLLAIGNGFITPQDLEAQEPFIYLALSGLTILEAIYHSKDCLGIELLEGKMVTRNNCPQDDNFPILVDTILRGKEMMQKCYGNAMIISSEEFLVIKQICLTKGNDLPEYMLTPQASQCAALIMGMSIQISQAPMFQKMISKVIEACLESLGPIAEPKSFFGS